nr:hypothetical protein [Tanacetum cinerariifolium]
LVDAVLQVAVEEDGRDRDGQARRRADQRLGDTTGQHARVTGHAGAGERTEDVDHAQHGAEQPQQRGHGGDGAKRGETLDDDSDGGDGTQNDR